MHTMCVLTTVGGEGCQKVSTQIITIKLEK